MRVGDEFEVFLWKQWMESHLPGNCTYDTASGKTKRTVGKYCVVSFVIF